MLSMNVFSQDAFSAVSLSAAVDRMDFVPGFLSGLPGLIEPVPVRTDVIWIEDRTTGVPTILPFSPRGTPPHQTGGDKRKARSYQTLRYGDASRITASELWAIRDFGSEVSLKTLQGEVARRQFLIKRNTQLTKEYHIFNLITSALVKDSAGNTLIDWAAEWAQSGSMLAELDFDLGNATPGPVRTKCVAVRRAILKNLKGIGTPRDIIGICGDTFFDKLTNHTEVKATYLNWQAAADLRGNNGYGAEWASFRYGNILFVNYRGTDDGTTLAIGASKCKFFPVGAGIFQWAQSPGESFEHLGQLGQEYYSRMVVDKDRDQWADVEVFSYPLPVCLQPIAIYPAQTTT